jgi:glycosyltransferase involved in cell wall biosynthesis
VEGRSPRFREQEKVGMSARTAGLEKWDPRKIVFITPSAYTLRFFHGFPRYLADRGFQLHVIAPPEQPLWDFCQREQCVPHAVPVSRSIAPLQDAISVGQLWRTLRRIRPAIVESHQTKAGLVGMLAAWAARVPVRVYTNHGAAFASATGWKRALLKAADRLSCRLASRVHCVSRSVRQLMIDEGCCAEEKIRVLGNGSCGIDAEERFNTHRLAGNRRQIRASLGIPPDAPVLGFVARIAREKGVDDLAQAWRLLRERFPDLHLLMVGAPELRDPVGAETMAFLRSDPRIHLTGEVADMPAHYCAMDVLTLPSHREGMGMSLLEGASMELPVVASNIPGIVDAVADGATGTLVPARDAAALAVAVGRYLDQPALRRRHGLAGRQRVRQNFQRELVWNATCHEYVALLRAAGMGVPEVAPALERRAA